MWPEMARMPLAGQEFPDLAVWHLVSNVLHGGLFTTLSIGAFWHRIVCPWDLLDNFLSIQSCKDSLIIWRCE